MTESFSTDCEQCIETPSGRTPKSSLTPSDGWHSFEDKLRRAGRNGFKNYTLALAAAGHIKHPDPTVRKVAIELNALAKEFERETEAAKAYRREAASELAYLLARRREIGDYFKAPTLRRLLDDVCKEHGCTPDELRGPRRNSELVHARRDYFYRAFKDTNKSLSQIGRFINKDHSTVIHGINKMREWMGEVK